MKPGVYFFKVAYLGYDPITEKVVIQKDKPALLTYTMKQSAAYQASLQTLKIKRQETRQYTQKLLFGCGAALMSLGAYYFDINAHQKLSLANEIAARYDQARSNFDSYRIDYYRSRDSARNALGVRDVLYVAAGACVFGFAFSFLF
jgi:hypothetical protein